MKSNDEQLSEIIDSCSSRIQAGEALDEILKDFPDDADELRELLPLVVDLAKLPTPEVSHHEMFKTVTKLTLDNERMTQTLEKPLLFKPLFFKFAASILIIFFLGAGTIGAASNALPGDFLYPIKLLTEKVNFILTVNPGRKVELRITFSEERLKELLKLYKEGKKPKQELFKSVLQEASKALESTPELSGVNAKIADAKRLAFAHFQEKTLKYLEPLATPAEKHLIENCVKSCRQICRTLKCNCNSSGHNKDMGSNKTLQKH